MVGPSREVVPGADPVKMAQNMSPLLGCCLRICIHACIAVKDLQDPAELREEGLCILSDRSGAALQGTLQSTKQ